jgi:endonuclease/exonuclease/phosphatase family metal-dependent hydrolase
MIPLVIEHHPYRSVADLGRKLARRLAHTGSTFSGVGASDKPRAVHAAACAPIALVSTSAVQPRKLKIATWNLEHLAEQNGVGCRPRTDADYAELRRHVAALDADVIAFQEVEAKAAAERVFDPAHYDVVISGRPISARGGSCAGKPGLSIRQQDVGFAIRKGVAWSRNPDLVELGLGNPDLRWGVDITLRAGTPMRLLAVHLKSGCNIGRSPDDADCPVLFNQLPVLKRWIDARVADKDAYAILGDWNRRRPTDDQFFGALDRSQPSAADLTLADEGRPASCQARYSAFIDHIVTRAKATTKVVPGSFAEYTYGSPEGEHPFDHCPSSIKLRAS